MARRAALLVAAALVLGGCGGGSLTADALKKQAQTVQGLAAEGALVAGDAAKGSTTGPYTREHASELATAAQSSAKTLRSAQAPQQLDAKRKRVAELAARTASALDRVPSGRTDARRAASELTRIAQAAGKLGQ
jgi:hypothetical protein